MADPEVCRSVKDDAFLTTADALAYLKTTPRTLYRRLANGEIPAVRLGRQWRFRKGDLDRWVERGDEPTSRGVPQAERRSAPPRVLIADDDADVLATLVNILAVTDYRIETVRNGLAAMTRLRQTAFDLLLTDLMMPGPDGIEVAREAKKLWPAIKVIIVTGYPTTSSAIDALNLGVDGYVTKPFDPEDVLKATAHALNLEAGARHAARTVTTHS
jgi:excisionase family DNA binding protein